MGEYAVPSPTAPLGQLIRFGTELFPGYESFGGFTNLQDRVTPVGEAWRRDGGLPSSGSTIMEAVFAEARRLHHLDDDAADQDTYLRALVAHLGMVSGGRVATGDLTLRRRLQRIRHRVRRRFTFEA